MRPKTADVARGKWYGILVALGMESRFLTNKHQDCPLCGDGRDRWRWDDKNGSGSYFCSQCGHGDGMDLAVRWTGMDFKDVARQIDEMVGNIEKQEQKPKRDSSKWINKIMQEIQPLSEDDPVTRYLKGRGLPKSMMLRIHPSMTYFNEGKISGNYPAMISRVFDPQGNAASLHVTYLTPEGHKAPVQAAKKLLTSVPNGAAIRLTKTYEHLGIAEGVETALAVMKLHRVPCWAAISATILEKFQPPEGVKRVTVYGDNDANFVGQASAFRLANRLAREGYQVNVELPPEVGADFADLLEAV